MSDHVIGVFSARRRRQFELKNSAVGEGSVMVSRIWSYLDRLAVPTSTV